MNAIELARKEAEREFILQMIVAFMQHHGYTPSQNHLREWSQMFKEVSQ